MKDSFIGQFWASQQPARKQQKVGKSYDAEQPGTGTQQLDPASS
jgi:hypothetical protein